MNKELVSKCISELLGALAIVLFGCGTIVSSKSNPELVPFIPIIFGSTVTLMIYTVGHISGAHFNPAVTIAFASVRRFPWKEVPVYVISQIIGGIIGCILIGIFFQSPESFGATVPHVSNANALFIETVLTFFLMFVIISVATDSRAVGVMAGPAIGAIIMVDAFFGGPLTGASMNPARSIGPAFFESNVNTLWIYLLGPVLGAIAAAQLYELIRCDRKNNKQKQQAKGCC